MQIAGLPGRLAISEEVLAGTGFGKGTVPFLKGTQEKGTVPFCMAAIAQRHLIQDENAVSADRTWRVAAMCWIARDAGHGEFRNGAKLNPSRRRVGSVTGSGGATHAGSIIRSVAVAKYPH